MGSCVTEVDEALGQLEARFASKLIVNADLDRSMVSFQANKAEPVYRWFKFKEGFSAKLVSYLLSRFPLPSSGTLLDPFAGSGTALFPTAELGCIGAGIEVLPVAVSVIKARKASMTVRPQAFDKLASKLAQLDFPEFFDGRNVFDEVPITRGAFVPRTAEAVLGFRSYVESHVGSEEMRSLVILAAMAVLESASFTRKDGQYLRWDRRARTRGGNFDKGKIASFKPALSSQLRRMAQDLHSLPAASMRAARPELVQVFEGSCLDILPTFADRSVDIVLTSPPYCNRYDYTRTYGLELVYLGHDAAKIRELRQSLLSCTVENREKDKQLDVLYGAEDGLLHSARAAFGRQAALQLILSRLGSLRESRELNNPAICRLVRNYFLEMSVVIHELARVLRPRGVVIMVNDNVRYAGIAIPVDLILSDFARDAGLETEAIWILPNGKGNSSQQMARHGRDVLRKCIYVWRKA